MWVFTFTGDAHHVEEYRKLKKGVSENVPAQVYASPPERIRLCACFRG